MVRVKIEWTLEARLDLVDILEFYLQRNGNSIFSKRLNIKINESIKLLRKNPFLGIQTEDPAELLLLAIIKSFMRFLKSWSLLS